MIDEKSKVIRLLDKLIEEGEEIKKLSKNLYFSGNRKEIDPELYESWKTSCLTLLRSTFSSSSPHYDNFMNLKFFDHYNSIRIYLGILRGARNDIINGYFYHKDLMLSVNIYDSLFQRSLEYAKAGDFGKAFGVFQAVAEEITLKIMDYKKLKYDKDDGLTGFAGILLNAEVTDEETSGKLKEIDDFCSNNDTEKIDYKEFSALLKWAQGFLYSYLGSTILILN